MTEKNGQAEYIADYSHVVRGLHPNDRIIFDSDPKALVERVIELVSKDKINRASFRFDPAAPAQVPGVMGEPVA